MGARLAVAVALAVVAVGCGPGDDPARPGGGLGAGAGSGASMSRRAELPVPRTEVAGAVLGGELMVVGGLDAEAEASDLVHLYDPATDRWRPGPRLPVGLHHVGLAARGQRVWLAGGYANGPGGAWVAQSRTFSLGAGDESWREEPPLREARGGLAMAAAGDILVAVGGTTSAGVTDTVEVLVPGANEWRPGPKLSQRRDHLAAASSGGRVYSVAGRLGSLESNLTSVESWDPRAGGPWREEPALVDSRGGTSAGEVAGRICVAGGEEPAGTIASVECLAEGGWREAARLDVPRHGLAVAGLGSELHVVGGGPRPGLTVSGAHEVIEPGGR